MACEPGHIWPFQSYTCLKSHLRTSHFCFLGLHYVNNCILNVLESLKYAHTKYHFEILREKVNVHKEVFGVLWFC